MKPSPRLSARGRVGERQEASIALDEDGPAGRRGRDAHRSSDRVEGGLDAGRDQAGPELVERRGGRDEPTALRGLDLDLIADELLGEGRGEEATAGARRRGRPPPSPDRSRPAGPPRCCASCRATAMRSPRTALLVAPPPAPGPDEGDPADRLALDLDPVQDAAGPAERAVGGHGGRDRRRPRSSRPALRSAMATSLRVRPWTAAAATSLGRDAGDPRPTGPGHRRRSALDRSGIEPGAEREPGQDDELVDGIVALDVAASDRPPRSRRPGRRRGRRA